jgi:hypothetical protein
MNAFTCQSKHFQGLCCEHAGPCFQSRQASRSFLCMARRRSQPLQPCSYVQLKLPFQADQRRTCGEVSHSFILARMSHVTISPVRGNSAGPRLHQRLVHPAAATIHHAAAKRACTRFYASADPQAQMRRSWDRFRGTR